jgi:hypothetical protein
VVTSAARRTSTYLYPWDVVGDPAAPESVAALGVRSVSLAAVYHAVRGVTPRHPRHRIVVAPDAATYFTPDPSRWSGQRLTPLAAEWLDADSFGRAADDLSRAGIGVCAWVVLAHNNSVGSAHPDVSVINAFGDRYPWALCIASGEVRHYAATLAAEVVERFDVEAIELEACGWYGVDHSSAHDKAQLDKLSEAARDLLSLCFCATCRHGLGRVGVDVERLRALVAAGIDSAFTGARPSGASAAAEIDALLGADVAGAVLAYRLAAANRLRSEVVTAARQAASTRPLTVWLRAQTTALGAGGNVGVDVDGAWPDVDGVLLSLADESPGSIASATALAVANEGRVGVVADVLVRRSESAEAAMSQQMDDVGRLGVTDLHLYHAGLATERGRSLLAGLARRFSR